MLYFSVVIHKLQYTPVMWKSITSLMLEILNAFRSSRFLAFYFCPSSVNISVLGVPIFVTSETFLYFVLIHLLRNVRSPDVPTRRIQ